MNTPVQGTAADIIKMAMLQLHANLQTKSLQSRMLVQIHDELVFEVPQEELAEVQVLVRQEMEKAMSLRVPLVVNLHYGESLDKE